MGDPQRNRSAGLCCCRCGRAPTAHPAGPLPDPTVPRRSCMSSCLSAGPRPNPRGRLCWVSRQTRGCTMRRSCTAAPRAAAGIAPADSALHHVDRSSSRPEAEVGQKCRVLNRGMPGFAAGTRGYHRLRCLRALCPLPGICTLCFPRALQRSGLVRERLQLLGHRPAWYKDQVGDDTLHSSTSRHLSMIPAFECDKGYSGNPTLSAS